MCLPESQSEMSSKKIYTAKVLEIFVDTAEIVQNFNRSDDSNYSKIFELLSRVVLFDNATIYGFDKDEEKVRLYAFSGKEINLIQNVDFDYGRGFSGWVAKSRRIIVLNNLKKKKGGSAIGSFLSLPLLVENDLVGVINFSAEEENHFSDQNISDFRILTPLVASLISHNMYLEKLTDQTRKLNLTYEQLKKTQEKLISLERKMTAKAFAGSMNHELNNPLMIILGNVQLLIQETQEEKTLKKLNVIMREIERMAKVVKKFKNINDPKFVKYLEDESDSSYLIE